MANQSRFKIMFFVWPNGNCPCQEFYGSLDKDVQAKFVAIWNRIEASSDGQLRDTDKLWKLRGDRAHDLWEMRVKWNGMWYRILCFRDGPDWILTHGFIKKSRETRPEEIDRGAEMKKAYEEMRKKTARKG